MNANSATQPLKRIVFIKIWDYYRYLWEIISKGEIELAGEAYEGQAARMENQQKTGKSLWRC